ncbi:MAG: binding-protein-dependent transport system inner rane component [Actinomycetia bacterium]|nr:binding-protein-dependent transport system inner rane component [Actinomycetes bacterium]
MRSPLPRRLGWYLLFGTGAALMLFPFLWSVASSFEPAGSVLDKPRLIPRHPSLDGYRTFLSALPFWRLLANSMGLALCSTVLQLVTSSMAAYAFARLEFPGRRVIFGIYLATMMMPLQVLVVPLFVEMKQFDLVDTYAAVLAPTIASAFGVFLLRQAIVAVPRELDEAAVMDGAGHLRIFATVILPLIRPALATFAVFAFMASWNSFLWPLVIIRSPEFMTLPLGLSNLHGQYTTEWNVVMAGTVLSVLPIILLYLAAQKYVVQSTALTGLK